MTDTQPERWRLRLENYDKAVELLSEAVSLAKTRELSELEKAGSVQRFEIAWELGWKLMADYLSDQLAPPNEYTPTKSIRAAFFAGLIADGDAWIAAGRLRNQLSHTYNKAARDAGLQLIETSFLAELVGFRETMLAHSRV